MKEREIVNDLDFEIEYRLVKKKGSQKPFKKLKPKKGAVIPKGDLGNVRLDFRVPKHKDIKTIFRNYITVFSASSIQTQTDFDIFTYHLILSELKEDWGFEGKDEDIELKDPRDDKDY
jgi:hypothetical protein